jgi:actin-related protein
LDSPKHCRFETFDVPGLHIGVQAVLALYASWAAAKHKDAVRLTCCCCHGCCCFCCYWLGLLL